MRRPSKSSMIPWKVRFSARTLRCGRKSSVAASNVRLRRRCDTDEKGGDATEEEAVEEAKEDNEEGSEGEAHNEARELESMLRSFETDLNCGEEGKTLDLVDPADAAGVVEDFDIDEYERAFGDSLQEYYCLLHKTAGTGRQKMDSRNDKMKCKGAFVYAVLLVCVVAINGNYQLSFTPPFTNFDSSGTYFDS